MAAGGVLDVLDVSTDVGLDGAVLEDSVAHAVEGAVLEHEVVDIAEKLLAGEVATHESHVLGMPGEVFAIELGVVDGDVLALPEGVLGEDLGIVHLDVLAILEDVLGVALESVDVDVVGEHEGVGSAVEPHVLDSDSVDLPEGFVGIGDLDVLEFQILHLAEELGSVDAAVGHQEVVGVPDGRARAHGEVAVVDACSVDVPPRVLAVELAVVGLDVPALLDARLSVGDGDALQAQVVLGEQGSLAAKLSVFNQFHVCR